MGKNNWNGPSLRQPYIPRKTRKNPFTQERAPSLYRKRRRSFIPRRLRAFSRLLAAKSQDIVFLTRYAAHLVLFLVVLLGSLLHGTNLAYVLQLGPSLANASATNDSLWQSNQNSEDIYLTWENVPVSLINEQPAAARSEPITYQVREGDNPQTIAQRFGLNPLTVIWANTEFEENPYLLALGQTLLLPPVDGVLHTVELGDSLPAIAAVYQVDELAIAEYASNNLNARNGNSPTFLPGQQLIIPGGVKALPENQQGEVIVSPDEAQFDRIDSTGSQNQNPALALGSPSVATSTLIAFPTEQATFTPASSTNVPTLAPISATQIPVTSVVVEPIITGQRATATLIRLTSTSIPATATEIRPTETRILPTATQVPPTWTSVPPTITPIPPTLAPFEPTWTSIPPTWTPPPPTRTSIPPTWTSVPPTWTSVPPTWTSVPPTWTSVPPTWTSVPPTWTSVPPTWTSVPPTWTSVPTRIARPAATFTAILPTWTRIPPTATFLPPTPTEIPTWTPVPSYTPIPTSTPIPSYTPEPTWTPIPSYTPEPTWTPLPTATPVIYICCAWPMSGRITTQPSSWHMALDIVGPYGTPIRSGGTGYVVAAGWDNTGYGYRVIIDHGDGIRTLYAHLSTFSVSYGDFVGQGQVIGQLGSSGRSTGPHLHFEVRRYGYRQNPYSWLP